MIRSASYEALQYEIFSNLLKFLKGIILFTINPTWIELKPPRWEARYYPSRAISLWRHMRQPINYLYVVLEDDHSGRGLRH
jgi:hypothetical protein